MILSERKVLRFIYAITTCLVIGNFSRNEPDLALNSPKDAFTDSNRRIRFIDSNKTVNSNIKALHVDERFKSNQDSYASSISHVQEDADNPLADDFQVSQFTPHLKQLVEAVDLQLTNKACTARYRFKVDSPGTIPTVNPRSKIKPDSIQSWWLTALRERVFPKAKGRVLPGNVTLRLSTADWNDPNKNGHSCFGSAGPSGNFTVINFLEIQRLVYNETFPTLPWDTRNKVPIWRGSPWICRIDPHDRFENKENASTVLQELIDMKKVKRLALLKFSHDHPDLVDAGISSTRGLPAKLWEHNATNGLHELLPVVPIQKDLYYANYQVAVVMGGVGAAFRTPVHLSTGTAVVLQDYFVEEWYVQFMQPFVHYIPLARDLSDLNETLHWVRNNPEKVKNIAKNGQEFYEKYLSFDRMEEFLYELIYRLALKANQQRSMT